MLSLSLPVRVYLCLEPTKYAAKLRRVVPHGCASMSWADPLSGDLFVFRSTRGYCAQAPLLLGMGWR